ncbi:hypothetical protein HAX54_002474 [Datura stramonium]|uniref:F-box domain-containing protein n=1 Tax=Datura stramonium TaxID=4076 RepID=A0ABS8RWD1_DATST|nr:hypothetical protein [Datura stramonium]
MDRTSELPTEILHQILSLLPTKSAAQATVLSKPWLRAYCTNPHLCFDESDFCRLGNFHGKFLRLVDDTLERYRRDENQPISAFKLCISFCDQTGYDGLVDKWLDIITQKRASKVSLSVKCTSESYPERYSLLADTIFAMKFTQQLELNRCNILLVKQKALLYEDKIKCGNLKNLTLCSVTVSQLALDSLISCCQQIQTVSFQYCIGFHRIHVLKNHPNLLSLSILCCPIVDVHIVDAPKMLSFEYVNRGNNFDPYSSHHNNVGMCLHTLKIGTCQNLKRVEFVKVAIDGKVLFKLIKKLRSVKELILHYCRYLRKIKISSSTLEVCSIVKCDLLAQAIFDVPKLLSLAFSDQYRLPCLSFKSASSQSRISINFEILRDVEQLMHLRRSLVELRDHVVDLTLSTISKSLSSARGIYHLPTLEVEHLVLSYCEFKSATYSSYYDVIFSICWPKMLTLQCDKRFGKFIRQQWLKKRENRIIKCTWKKYLINAQIEYKKRTGDDWMTLDRKMLVADPRIIEEIYTIRFKQIQKREKNTFSYISRCIPRWIAHRLE